MHKSQRFIPTDKVEMAKLARRAILDDLDQVFQIPVELANNQGFEVASDQFETWKEALRKVVKDIGDLFDTQDDTDSI